MSRLHHSLVTRAAAAAVLCSRTADAQDSRGASLPNPRRLFEDSWFWGVKGGATSFGTSTEGRTMAPLAGAEWLITHRHGALLVSAEQAFFNTTSIVADPSTAEGLRAVDVKDARRYSVAALAAPSELGWVRPYGGIGLAMQVVRRAVPEGRFATQAQYDFVADRIDDGQSLVAPFLVAGAQAQRGRVAWFVQGSTAAEQKRSLLGHGAALQIEAGVRVNVAASSER